jgi:hypothetical protein
MKKEKKRTFESEALALPPLRMVLSDNKQRKPPARKKRLLSPEEQAKEDALWKLIERLGEKN